MLKMDLHKSAQSLKLSLNKAGITEVPEVDLAFILDVSGSFDDEHRDGLTDAILCRLVPWGMVFDPDKKLDVFSFSDGKSHAFYVGEVTPDTVEGYIRRNIINKVPGYGHGTDYVHVLRKMLVHFGWLQPENPQEEAPKRGLLSRIFGQKNEPVAAAAPPVKKRKSMALFVTDGDNDHFDEGPTEQLLEEMERRGDEVYIQFFGMSGQKPKYTFLKRMAERFKNTGLYICYDIPKFVKMSDEEINTVIISEELVEWLKK